MKSLAVRAAGGRVRGALGARQGALRRVIGAGAPVIWAMLTK